MSPFDVPATLILPQDSAFGTVRAVLEGAGFVPAAGGLLTAPLVPGEPEAAAWTFGDGLPTVHYRFNPVAFLRVLEVSTVPPEPRAALAVALGALPGKAIDDALAASDERRLLWGVWAAAETERIDLLPALEGAQSRARGLVREEVEDAAMRLADLADAFGATIAGAHTVAAIAVEITAALTDVRVLSDLLPTEAGCHAVFHASIADEAWRQVRTRPPPARGLRAPAAAPQDVFVGTGGALRGVNAMSARFPRGYRTIAGWLSTDKVWVGWQGREADGATRLMDGLVFLNERWMFFPKPYRDIEPLLPRIDPTAFVRGR